MRGFSIARMIRAVIDGLVLAKELWTEATT